jgi:hypothetical protein
MKNTNSTVTPLSARNFKGITSKEVKELKDDVRGLLDNYLLGLYQYLELNKMPMPLFIVDEVHNRGLVGSYTGTFNSNMY